MESARVLPADCRDDRQRAEAAPTRGLSSETLPPARASKHFKLLKEAHDAAERYAGSDRIAYNKLIRAQHSNPDEMIYGVVKPEIDFSRLAAVLVELALYQADLARNQSKNREDSVGAV